MALSLAGWLVEFVLPIGPCGDRPQLDPMPVTWCILRWVPVAIVACVVIFTTMNWQLYQGLLVPHGDSAMHEEHLWNITHGRGFRSYLDQGLFLGEHI